MISSPANPLVKLARRLSRNPTRKSGRLLVEGMKLAREALAGGVRVEHALLSSGFAESERGEYLERELAKEGVRSTVLLEKLFRQISTLDSPEGILLIARRPERSFSEVEGDLVVVLAGVQDPGNVGAVARVAEAAGASGLVLCEASCDPFQAKALRGAMGSLFRLPVWEGGPPETVEATLRASGFTTVACVPKEGTPFHRADLERRVALFLGSEGPGLAAALVSAVAERITIPMRRPVESLNVAVVAGLVLYESARQRGRL